MPYTPSTVEAEFLAWDNSPRQPDQVNENFRLFLDASPDAIVICDPAGTIETVNGQFEYDFGYTPNEVIGKSQHILLHKQSLRLYNRLFNKYRENPRTRTLIGIESNIWAKRKDGSKFPVELSLSPIDVAGMPYIVAAVRNIGPQKKALEELIEAKNQAEAANQAKTAFVANMSHEIRTPLGIVLGYAEMLHNDFDDNLDRRLYAQLIRKNGQHLLALLNDILDLSKVESANLELDLARIDTLQFIYESIESMSLRAMEKGLSYELSISRQIPSHIYSDEKVFRQIMVNVLGNAIKFTDRGKIMVDVSWRQIKSCKQSLVITVNDTGCGITQESQRRIFEPFTQAEKFISRRYGGTGLGLSLSRHLAANLGGDVILVHSKPAVGSSFEISIDIGRVNNASWVSHSDYENLRMSLRHPEPKDSDFLNSDNLQIVGIRVLVVEDFEDNQELIRMMLTRAGAQVRIANNGEEGVTMATSDHFDIVLMDIQMPVMNGYDATAKLRRLGYPQPILALTAHARNDELERCIACGCDGYIPKPIKWVELTKKIQAHTTPQ